MCNKHLLIILLLSTLITASFMVNLDVVDKTPSATSYSTGIYHTNKSITTSLPDYSEIINSINADSLAWFVQQLENMGTRFCYANNRFEVSHWIADQFTRLGYSDVSLDPFTSEANNLGQVDQLNVIAILEGRLYPDEYIIIGAHHDSFSSSYTHSMTTAPGADDNASGTAAVLEIARVLKLHNVQPLYSIRFMTYAMEELWMHGSYHDAAKVVEEGINIRAMFNLDMIGNQPDDLDWIFKIVRYPNGDFLLNKALARAEQMDMQIFSTYEGMHLSDGIPYYQIGVPVIYFFEYHFSEQYHSDTDILVNLNLPYFEMFTKLIAYTLLDVINDDNLINEEDKTQPLFANLNLNNYPNPFNPSTTIEFTLRQPSFAEINIFDIRGKLVKQYPRTKYLSGVNKIQFDAETLSSGVYFYRIKTDYEITETKKMVLMK